VIVRLFQLALVLPVVVVLGLASVPVFHTHAASEPAFYSAECPLAELATRVAGAPLPSPGDAEAPVVVSHDGWWGIVLDPLAVVPLPFGSRAPPSR
jgi:hypothetical protein